MINKINNGNGGYVMATLKENNASFPKYSIITGLLEKERNRHPTLLLLNCWDL
jgi:hypothetical protein